MNRYSFMQEILVMDEPIFQDGYIKLPNKPGLGIELDPDVAQAHLGDGEVRWG